MNKKVKMYELIEDKYVVDTDNKLFCSACLSKGRYLININKLAGYVEVLRSLCNDFIQMIQVQDLMLCWECVAIIKRINQFKKKVHQAQLFKAQKEINLISLSNLSIYKTDNIINVTYNEENENKKELLHTIKNETYSNYASDDNEQNLAEPAETHNLSLSKIKKENKPERKHTKKFYKIVYGPNVFKKNELRKRISIDSDEFLLWYEKEKEYYKLFNYKCKLCFHGFNSKQRLTKHYGLYHNESTGKHICPTCNKIFPSVSKLRSHKHTYIERCILCGFQCMSVRRIYAHIHTHRQLQCLECGVCLPNLHLFKDHYKLTHREFICDYCGKRCKTKYLITKHISSRHNTTFSCESCTKTYKSRAALNKHRTIRHSVATRVEPYYARRYKHKNKKIPCPECNNTYSRRSYMMNHFRHVHSNQSKYHCEQCDRNFLNRTRYRDHVKFHHEGLRPEKNKLCNLCGKKFTTNRSLENHLRTHSGERPFTCEFCSAKFSQKHSMKSHIKFIHEKKSRRTDW